MSIHDLYPFVVSIPHLCLYKLKVSLSSLFLMWQILQVPAYFYSLS